jgi:hypothetical protein
MDPAWNMFVAGPGGAALASWPDSDIRRFSPRNYCILVTGKPTPIV